MDASHFDTDPARRFGGIDRLYGEGAVARLGATRVCVVGIGGVGSWAAEALARSGVGHLTLIDLDHVAESNINRQAHALETSLGQAKVLAMGERIRAINPRVSLRAVEEFVDADNAAALLQGCDCVIDAIDNVRAKVAMVLACTAAHVPLIVAGGAGGKRDPRNVRVADLAHTYQDPLLAKVRKRLRTEHGFPRDTRRRFGIEAVYVEEPLRMPEALCDSAQGPQGLACAGYGSSMMVTAAVGLQLAARVLERLLADTVNAGTAGTAREA